MAEGYARLAALLGRDPKLAMFLRFSELNIKNLLYMQAELVNDEAELKIIEDEDKESRFPVATPEEAKYHASWTALKESFETGTPKTQSRLHKVLEIREKLRNYNSTLLQVAQIQKFSKPVRANIAFMSKWLEREDGGNGFLYAREQYPWDSLRTNDLVLPSLQHTRKDRLAQWISNHTVPWFHRYVGYRMKQRVSDDAFGEFWEYDEEYFVNIANCICTALSGLLPSVSIFVLYYLEDPTSRLTVSMVFTMCFSCALTLIVRARRAEIFAATTAFAAIQVAFIAGNNFQGNDGGNKE